MLGYEALFDHLTTREIDKQTRKRDFCYVRSERLHWIKYHVEENKKNFMLIFPDIDDGKQKMYIIDIVESYIIILQEFYNGKFYHLLTAHKLSKKNLKKFMNKASRIMKKPIQKASYT